MHVFFFFFKESCRFFKQGTLFKQQGKTVQKRIGASFDGESNFGQINTEAKMTRMKSKC